MQPGNPFATPATSSAGGFPVDPGQLAAPNPFGQTIAPAASPFAVPAVPAIGGFVTGEADEYGMAPEAERVGPRIRDYGIGRLVLVYPITVERVRDKYGKGENPMKDRVTCNIVALDGAPIPWGGTPEKVAGPQHDKVLPVGTLVEDFQIWNSALVRVCCKFIPPAKPFKFLARIQVTEARPGENGAWIFDSSTITAREIALATQWRQHYEATTIGSA